MLSSEMSTPLRTVTSKEVAHYREHGWVYLPSLIDRSVITELLSDAKARAAQEQLRPPVSAAATYFTIYQRLALQRPEWAKIALGEAMARNIECLMQVSRVRFYQDSLLVKQPEGDVHGATTYHQDFPFHALDRSNWLTVWVALADLPASSGTMRFYSGSHQLGSLGRTVVSGEDAAYRCEAAGSKLSEARDLAAGDATVHNALTVHGAPANRTTASRWAYTALYMDEATLYTGAPYKPVDMTGLQPSGKVDERFPVLR
jgi:ectoine hydroxylase-related dioxygenase (phytanoyl-CoA dioxygenase family)